MREFYYCTCGSALAVVPEYQDRLQQETVCGGCGLKTRLSINGRWAIVQIGSSRKRIDRFHFSGIQTDFEIPDGESDDYMQDEQAARNEKRSMKLRSHLKRHLGALRMCNNDDEHASSLSLSTALWAFMSLSDEELDRDEAPGCCSNCKHLNEAPAEDPCKTCLGVGPTAWEADE